MAQEKPVLIYIGDPLCSWCYGFSPEISSTKEKMSDNVDFQLVMGGLRPYNTETMADLGDFLKDHWKHVSKRSDVPFNYEILKDESFVYDTEPPARAVVVMRTLNPEKEFDFFKDIQRAFYADNKDTGLLDTYLDLISEYNVDKTEFKRLFESDEMKELVKRDFSLSSSMGVSGFPSTVLKYNGQYFMTSNGYLESTQLIENIEGILEKK